jgi:hypothetical protein
MKRLRIKPKAIVHILCGILTALLAAGCFDFEANHMVTKFKILAVTTEPAEISPGEGFDMEVLYADPAGEGRDVSFAWFMCVNGVSATTPLSPQIGMQACVPAVPPRVGSATDDGRIFVAESTPQNLMDLYPDALLNQPGGVPLDAQLVYVTAVVVACAGGQLPEQSELAAAVTTVENPKDLCVGGDGVAAYKALRISPAENQTPNENPVIEQITFDGQPVALSDATGSPNEVPISLSCNSVKDCHVKVDINVFLSSASRQSYHTKAEDGFERVAETLYVTWFITGGELNRDRTIADHPTGPYDAEWEADEPGQYTLWAVAHDTRGGVSWESFNVQVTPAQ